MIRLMSACASGVTPRPGKLERMFIGRCSRKARNPACISALTAAGERARRRVFRPQLEGRERFGEVFADRQALPYHDVAMAQRRHPPGRRVFQDRLAAGRLIERDHHLVEVDRGALQDEPRPQRPRGVVLVAEIDRQVGHNGLRLMMARYFDDNTPARQSTQNATAACSAHAAGVPAGYSMPSGVRALGRRKGAVERGEVLVRQLEVERAAVLAHMLQPRLPSGSRSCRPAAGARRARPAPRWRRAARRPAAAPRLPSMRPCSERGIGHDRDAALAAPRDQLPFRAAARQIVEDLVGRRRFRRRPVPTHSFMSSVLKLLTP